MTRKKTRLQIISRGPEPVAKRTGVARQAGSGPPVVSGRWLISAVILSIAGAALCCWAALCLLFWQGSWQLLYHPTASLTRTPASIGLAFDPVQFDMSDAGLPQLKGWWIPATPGASFTHFTFIYLHGERGNLGDTVDALGQLHTIGVNILAFDYRGYGQSQFVRPSETHWRADAISAIEYLVATRHVNPASIVLDGDGLGANLALEVAATHPELAGVVVDLPLENPMKAIFDDARARLVPAHLLVRDRYDLDTAATGVHVPVLWIQNVKQDEESRAFAQIAAHKMMLELEEGSNAHRVVADALDRWLDELPAR